MARKKNETFYIITYHDPKDNKTRSLKAKNVTDSTLGLSFVVISDFVFDTNALVVNPDDETMKKRLENVKALHMSIYNILSIEEVGADHKGLAFKTDKSKLVVLPGNDNASPKK